MGVAPEDWHPRVTTVLHTHTKREKKKKLALVAIDTFDKTAIIIRGPVDVSLSFLSPPLCTVGPKHTWITACQWDLSHLCLHTSPLPHSPEILAHKGYLTSIYWNEHSATTSWNIASLGMRQGRLLLLITERHVERREVMLASLQQCASEQPQSLSTWQFAWGWWGRRGDSSDKAFFFPCMEKLKTGMMLDPIWYSAPIMIKFLIFVIRIFIRV